MRVTIVGGGSAIAQGLISYYLNPSWNHVTAICNSTLPQLEPIPDRLEILRSEYPLKPTDLLITTTGSVANRKLDSMAGKEWNDVIKSTLGAVGEALRYSKINDGGNVVVVGSIIGSTGGYGCANYAAAKAGLVGLVRAAANEMAHQNICVNLLELGYCNAGMGERLDPQIKDAILKTIPLKRFATLAEVVDAIAWLGRVRFMTGNVLTFAGGMVGHG